MSAFRDLTELVSCGYFGPYLHLLLLERCCYTCLCFNHSLRLLPVPRAKKYFGLDTKDLQNVPVLWTIPGSYHVRKMNVRKTCRPLVSVKTVKQLALEIHSSQSALERIYFKNLEGRNEHEKALVCAMINAHSNQFKATILRDFLYRRICMIILLEWVCYISCSHDA
jgi:hypothetical protein